MLSYLLFSAIDRAEIVFHHLCFLLMYMCSTAGGSSPLLLNCHTLKHEIRHQQFSNCIQTFHTENVFIPIPWVGTFTVNFTLQWGLLAICFEKCQWPLGMPALPPLEENIDRCINSKSASEPTLSLPVSKKQSKQLRYN